MSPAEPRAYLNHAASSHPKPEPVGRAILAALEQEPADPHRGPCAYDSLGACREELALLVHAWDARRILLMPSATFALNQAIYGMIARHRQRKSASDKVRCLTTVLEHNSVLRPLAHARDAGWIDLTILSEAEVASPDRIESHLRKGIRLVVMTACSNVTGACPDLRAIGGLCSAHGADLIVDAAQAAGCIDLDVKLLPPRAILAFSGHKGLLGPQGTGALYLGEGFATEEMEPIVRGGTGVKGDMLSQPSELPLRYESGTLNQPGFAGLAAAVRHVRSAGVLGLGAQRSRLSLLLKDRLRGLPAIRILETKMDDPASGIVSMSLAGWEPNEAMHLLSDSYGIVTRGGLHCAPLIHREHGLRGGSLRASAGWGNTEDDVLRLASALEDLTRARVAA